VLISSLQFSVNIVLEFKPTLNTVEVTQRSAKGHQGVSFRRNLFFFGSKRHRRHVRKMTGASTLHGAGVTSLSLWVLISSRLD